MKTFFNWLGESNPELLEAMKERYPEIAEHCGHCGIGDEKPKRKRKKSRGKKQEDVEIERQCRRDVFAVGIVTQNV